MGRFDALQEEDTDESNDSDELTPKQHDDLSIARADEETVLAAVYGDDFTKNRTTLQVHVRPPNGAPIGSELTLAVQTSKLYPNVVPTISLLHIMVLSSTEQADLTKRLA